jgi:hypothetical protein
MHNTERFRFLYVSYKKNTVFASIKIGILAMILYSIEKKIKKVGYI